MAIKQFLNAEGEEVDDDREVVVDEIATLYSVGDKTHETDEEDVVIPQVGYFGAMKALQKPRLYEEQHENGDSQLISRINRHERLMRAPGFQSLKQSSIRSFLIEVFCI